MDFGNLKVSTRLSLGFGAMLALLALTGFWGMHTAQQTVDMLQSITVEDYKNELAIKSIRSLMETNRSQVLQLLQHNPATEYSKWHDHPLDVHYKNIADATEQLTGLWAKYEAGARTAEEKRLAAAWFDKTHGLGVGDVEKAVNGVKAGQWDVAQAALIKGINPSYREGEVALKALREHFSARMIENEAAVDRRLHTNSYVMLAILGSSILAAIFLVFRLVRMFQRQLGGEPSVAREFSTQIARGNLAQRVNVAVNDRESVLYAMSAMQSGLAEVVAKVRQGSESVLVASQQIATGNHDLSARTETQASALQETAASMEQLSSTVKQNADNAALANQLANSASGLATSGGAVVAQVVESMRSIEESAKRIGDIIGVIDGIAFQTNILALNAAVEAARAGEQGRGFAVVAGEVRTLARRSSDAAKEIKVLIGESVERVEQGSDLVGQAGATMKEIVAAIQRVNDVVSEISVASREQSDGVAQVGEAVVQLDQATQQNAALVEQVAAAASSLSGQAQTLVEAVAVFNLGESSGSREGGLAGALA